MNTHPLANGKKGKGGKQSHNREAAHPLQKSRATPPARQHQRRHPRAPPIEHRGTTPPSPKTPSHKQRPTTTTGPPKGRRKRHPGEAGAHPSGEEAGHWPHGRGHSKKKKKKKPKRKGKVGRRPNGPGLRQATATTTEPQQTGPRATPTDPPPPRSQEDRKKKGGGRNPNHGDPHTIPSHRQPHQGVAANGRTARERSHAPTPQPEIAGRRTTQTQTHAPQTPGKTGRAQPKPISKHTHPRPQRGMAGLPWSPTPNARTTNPTQEWRGKAKIHAQTNTP